MPTVTEQATLPADVDPTRCAVEVQLYQADLRVLKEARDTVTGETVVGRRELTLDGTTAASPDPGAWALDLPGNASLTPSGTVWGRILRGPRVLPTLSYATVPTTGGPYQWKVIETDPPAAIDPSGLAAHAADGLLHGGGQLLAYADRSSNLVVAVTSPTDVAGLTLTFPVPAGPFVLECGAFCLIEEGIAGAAAVTSGSRSAGGVVTMNTAAAHGFTRDQIVVVNVADTTYNGAYAVASIPSSTQFTYSQASLTTDAASGTGTVGLISSPPAGGSLQLALSDNTVIGQDGARAKIANDLVFINRRVILPNWFHVPTPGASVTYKVRANTSHVTSDLTLLSTLFANDAPYIAAYTLRGQ